MNMRRTLAFALIACAICALFASTGCQKTSEDVIVESIINRFEPYRTMNGEVIERLSKTAEDEGLSEFGISDQDFAYAVLSGFDYKIDDIDVSENSATAKVTISSKSMSDFSQQLEQAETELGILGHQALTKEQKTEKIRERMMQAINDTAISSEPITLMFSLNGTEWTSGNATEELGKLDSVIFSG